MLKSKLNIILIPGLVLITLIMGLFFTEKEIKNINSKLYDPNNPACSNPLLPPPPLTINEGRFVVKDGMTIDTKWYEEREKNNIAKRKRTAAKRDLAKQEARTWAARRGYTIDHISDEGGVIMILYYNPRTGESDGEYFYY